jgi:hypothetical protein
LRSAFVQPSLIISDEPPLVLSSLLLDEQPTVSPPSGRARVLHMPGAEVDAEVDADSGDRTYLVLAKPNVIMNDIRLRGLAVA